MAAQPPINGLMLHFPLNSQCHLFNHSCILAALQATSRLSKPIKLSKTGIKEDSIAASLPKFTI
eukprot:3205164-Amphidinium_carterae.2